MTSTENHDETMPDIKVARPRKIRAPYRNLPDGTYDNKPLSPTYFRDYWPKKTEHCGITLHLFQMIKKGEMEEKTSSQSATSAERSSNRMRDVPHLLEIILSK